MIVGLFVCAVVVGLLFRRRARARAMLAGLDGSRPVFSVDPPTRRLARRKHEAL